MTNGYTLATMPGAVAAAFYVKLAKLDRSNPIVRADGSQPLRCASFAIAFEDRCGGEEVFDDYLNALDAMDAAESVGH